jgi:hypothetical protein
MRMPIEAAGGHATAFRDLGQEGSAPLNRALFWRSPGHSPNSGADRDGDRAAAFALSAAPARAASVADQPVLSSNMGHWRPETHNGAPGHATCNLKHQKVFEWPPFSLEQSFLDNV